MHTGSHISGEYHPQQKLFTRQDSQRSHPASLQNDDDADDED